MLPVQQAVSSYRPDIDGLRALAVSMVIVYHQGGTSISTGFFVPTSGEEARCPGGFTGVDVFFVISGFVVTGSLLRDRPASACTAFLRFYERRVKRLTPSLLLVVSASAVAYAMVLDMDQENLAEETWLTGTFGLIGGANLYLSLKEMNYYDEDGNGILRNPFMHLWSLGVEEQFYVLFPLILRWLHGWSAPRGDGATGFAVTGMTALIVASTFFQASLVIAGLVTSAFYLLPARAWQLLAGALTYELTGRGISADDANRLRVARPYLQLASFLLLSFSAMVVPPQGWGAIASGLPPTLGAVCFIVAGSPLPPPAEPAGSDKGGVTSGFCAPLQLILFKAGFDAYSSPLLDRCDFNSILGLAVPRYLGLISYPLYLWHWPVIVVWKAAFGLGASAPLPLLDALAATVISLALAIVTYHTVEAAARSWRPKPSWLVFLVALPSLGAAVTLLLLLNGPLGHRLYLGNPLRMMQLDALERWSPPEPQCTGKVTNLAPTLFANGSHCSPRLLYNEAGHDLGYVYCKAHPSEEDCACYDGGEGGAPPFTDEEVEACMRPSAAGDGSIASRRPWMVGIGDSHLRQLLPAMALAACGTTFDVRYYAAHFDIVPPLVSSLLKRDLRAGDLVLLSLVHTKYDKDPVGFGSAFSHVASIVASKGATLMMVGDNYMWELGAQRFDPAVQCFSLSGRMDEGCCVEERAVAASLANYTAFLTNLTVAFPGAVHLLKIWPSISCGPDRGCEAGQCSPRLPGGLPAMVDRHHITREAAVYVVGVGMRRYLETCV